MDEKEKIRKRDIPPMILKYIFLIAVLFITLIPILYTICASFKTNSEIMVHPERLLPMQPTLENYKIAWTSDMINIPRMFWNSTYYTLITVAITITISSLSGYVFARGGNFPGSKVIFACFSALMFVNFGSITIYAVFKVLNIFKLSNSLWGLIVKNFFAIGTVNIYLVRSYIRTLPKELDEAAEIDGSSFIGTYFKIILPLLKPILATLTILSFQGSWNDYLMPTLFTISRPEQRTLIVGITALKNSGNAASNWNLMLAGAVITIIPILVVYGFANKYFVNGLASGAVKG